MIVSIDCLLLVDGKGTCRLARAAASQPDIIDVVDVEGSLEKTTLEAFIDDFFELIENLTSYCYNSFYYIIRKILLINFPR